MALYVGLNVVYLAAAPASDLAGVVEVAHVAAQRLVGVSAGRMPSAGDSPAAPRSSRPASQVASACA